MADGREPVVGLWRSQPRRSSDSRCDCALRGRARYFNHVVNHSSSRVSEVSQLGLEKRGGSHCTAIRREPRHSQRTAFPIPFDLQRDTITCIRWQERAQTYHVTESRLRASAAAVILQSDLEVARILLFEFFFFPAWAKKNKKRNTIFIHLFMVSSRNAVLPKLRPTSGGGCRLQPDGGIWAFCDIAKVTVKIWFSLTPTFQWVRQAAKRYRRHKLLLFEGGRSDRWLLVQGFLGSQSVCP